MQLMSVSRKLSITLIAALVGLSSCKPEAEYTAPDSSYGLIYDQIFTPSCALSGCHAAGQKKRDPDGYPPFLEGEAAYNAVINTVPANSQAASAGLKLVWPSSPDSSFLYQKITFDSSAYRFGAEMPNGGLTLSANQIAFVRQWIAAGAPLAGHVADRSLMQ
jgi:hypothetical protein